MRGRSKGVGGCTEEIRPRIRDVRHCTSLMRGRITCVRGRIKDVRLRTKDVRPRIKDVNSPRTCVRDNARVATRFPTRKTRPRTPEYVRCMRVAASARPSRGPRERAAATNTGRTRAARRCTHTRRARRSGAGWVSRQQCWIRCWSRSGRRIRGPSCFMATPFAPATRGRAEPSECNHKLLGLRTACSRVSEWHPRACHGEGAKLRA